eukprot:6192368-Pleurochrysis_carterae.AAC.1
MRKTPKVQGAQHRLDCQRKRTSANRIRKVVIHALSHPLKGFISLLVLKRLPAAYPPKRAPSSCACMLPTKAVVWCKRTRTVRACDVRAAGMSHR